MAKKIGIGLSSASLIQLKSLRNLNYIDYISFPPKVFSKLVPPLPPEVIGCPTKETLLKNWDKGSIFYFVGALGAVVRLVSPFLSNKGDDPAVLVLDPNGLQVIPLLGGHSAGAEELALQLEGDLGVKPIFTGNSRTQGRLALDSFGELFGWKRTGSSADWSHLMFLQSNSSEINFLQKSGSKLWRNSESAKSLQASVEDKSNNFSSLLYIGSHRAYKCCWHPSTLWIGIGCEKKTSFSLIERAILETIKSSPFAIEAVAGLATIDIKSNDQGILNLARFRNWPIRYFTPQELSRVTVPNPSLIVEKEIGSSSVAEAASILAAGRLSTLSQEKRIFYANKEEEGAVTVAISESDKPFKANQGELHIVGIGPGNISYLTGDARKALARTVIWVGYTRYLNLIECIRRPDQIRFDSELTLERDRCLKAIDLARQGIRVSLVSSGDSGIYGMASLTLDLLLEDDYNVRPKVFIHPGITAVQMAASSVGSPLANDFCVISLSDRLSSWDDIKKKIIGAIKGNFVIAFYNPQSNERTWQLKTAIDLLLESRSPETPVIFARQISRNGETIKTYKLGDCPFEEVDMLTLVIIGNDESKIKQGYFLSPRGYSGT